jgi:hypothetical protein
MGGTAARVSATGSAWVREGARAPCFSNLHHGVPTQEAQVKVHDIRDPTGGLLAFEIDNFYVGRYSVVGIVEGIQGARITRRPKRLLSWFREDSFCEFEVNGVAFEALEPFGDNSRYWIGPIESRVAPETERVREIFARTGLPCWRHGRRQAG